MTFATIAKTLIEAIEDLKIPYFVCGSTASCAHGIPRATLDVDLVVQMTARRAVLLAAGLGQDWYLDADMARDALAHNRAFNVIQMGSSYRFDFFPPYTDFHASELQRATRDPLRFPGGEVLCYVASAEDTILSKLVWYREGGETSERQWTDIVGVLVISSDLDFDYLSRWAAKLNVADLLNRAVKASAEE